MWTKESIQSLLMSNDKAVGRALLVIMGNQTNDEVYQETTKYENGVGFTFADANVMTSMAKQFNRRDELSPRQLAWLRGGRSNRFHSRIGKYWGQLLVEIKRKESTQKGMM